MNIEARNALLMPANISLILGINLRNLKILSILNNRKTKRKETSGTKAKKANSDGKEIATKKKSNLFQGFRIYRHQPYMRILKKASSAKNMVKNKSTPSNTIES